MTKLGRITAILSLSLGLSLIAAGSWAQARPPIAKQIAETYGLSSYDQVDAFRYTFNLELPGVNIVRSWVWYPKTGEVTYEGKDKDGKPEKITYYRSQLDSAPDAVQNVVEPAFVNDEYNLFFPLHVSWDASADVQDQGAQKLPLEDGSARRVAVKYPSEGGYTPGDTWELYLGPDGRVAEFAYHRAGEKPPHLVIAKWAGYKKAGPMLFSTDRNGTADGKPVHFFFTDVAVKLAGSDAWVNAQ